MFLSSLIYYFVWILLFLFAIFLQILMKISEFNSYDNVVEDRYDYIIVGGGSAGSILAGRLSENSKLSVLLIEAGGEGYDILNIPILGPLKQMSVIDWQYATTPQKSACLGLENNVSKWPSGKILGGSTHLNYMIYLKGHKNDYKSWKDPDSDLWSIENIKFYFDKAEKCYSNQRKFCEEVGSIYVRNSLHSTKLSDAILQAAIELGYSVNDINLKTGTGFMKPKLNLDRFGMRWTSDQYLKSVAKKRNNLKILTFCTAEEILFLNKFEAFGVKVNKNGENKIFFANVEVIVSAGTVGSSKLLMLSGIGPENFLTKAKVPMKVNLSVGQNLQDHLTTGLDLTILKNDLFSLTDLLHPSSAFEYFFHARGPFTSGLVDAIGVVFSAQSNLVNSSPDLEFMVMMAGVSSDKGAFFRKSMGIKQKVWDKYFQSFINESVVSILPVLLHPKSVGEITLNPNDPKGMPIIDPKYLSNEEDVFTLIRGIRFVQKMINTKSLKNFGIKFNDKIFPGCEFWKYDSDEYWGCYIKHLTLTVYHPVGTCKMGKLNHNGVVDYRLRVHKTNKLRVIDASIMPELPSSNPNANVLMIAEMGADMIKEDYSERLSQCQMLEIFVSSTVCQSFTVFLPK